MLNFQAVPLRFPPDANIIVGQSHFIKTVEDIYETLVTAVPGIEFGVAFNEASGPRLTRADGNQADLKQAAIEICSDAGAGHMFAIVMRKAFPINVLNAVQRVPEVVNIFCATANPVQLLIAETEQGKGIAGVIDGGSPLGIEQEEHVPERQGFLRKIGYKR